MLNWCPRYRVAQPTACRLAARAAFFAHNPRRVNSLAFVSHQAIHCSGGTASFGLAPLGGSSSPTPFASTLSAPQCSKRVAGGSASSISRCASSSSSWNSCGRSWQSECRHCCRCSSLMRSSSSDSPCPFLPRPLLSHCRSRMSLACRCRSAAMSVAALVASVGSMFMPALIRPNHFRTNRWCSTLSATRASWHTDATLVRSPSASAPTLPHLPAVPLCIGSVNPASSRSSSGCPKSAHLASTALLLSLNARQSGITAVIAAKKRLVALSR